MMKYNAWLLSALLSVAPLHAEDRLDMEGIEIRGNSELPKALYIVPWKEAQERASAGKPVDSLTNEILTPLEREAFLRRLNHFRATEN